jgi:serine/threonine-protein kinase RIO1
MFRVSDYTMPYQVALVITLIYMQQVTYILTFTEIKSYYSSFETGKEANKNYAQKCGGNYKYLIKHYHNYI